MMQFDAGPAVDLGANARVSVFICHATGGRCEDWDSTKGANRVLLHRERDDNLYDGPPTVRVYRRMMLTVDEPLDELGMMMQVKERVLPMKQALEQLRHDKLGGGAVWLHGDDTPKSVSEDGKTRMVIQFTTELVSFDITKGGMGYVFIDPNDPDSNFGHFLWQGG